MIQGVKNYSVAVKKIQNEIVFIRKIIPGGADKSYGIEVAKLAGLPKEVINRANEILEVLENFNNTTEIDLIHEQTSKKNQSNKIKDKNDKINDKSAKTDKGNDAIKEVAVTYESKIAKDEAVQISFTDIEKDNLLKEIKDINILNLTPMDGFNKLYELVKRAKSL